MPAITDYSVAQISAATGRASGGGIYSCERSEQGGDVRACVPDAKEAPLVRRRGGGGGGDEVGRTARGPREQCCGGGCGRGHGARASGDGAEQSSAVTGQRQFGRRERDKVAARNSKRGSLESERSRLRADQGTWTAGAPFRRLPGPTRGTDHSPLR
jgi:hypothetical protein